MDKEKLINNVSLVILVFFGFVGVTMVGSFFHEYSHYNDFKHLAEQDQVCILNYEPSQGLAAGLGYYQFNYNLSAHEEVNQISKLTEYKAYAISISIALVFLIATIRIIHLKLDVI